ncbi:MAG: HAD family phosphatase [Lachnospiraceae bacterium]|nr:HAD family phosphatase [Lachnospiraceae bacterium]
MNTTLQPLAGIVFDMDGLMFDTERVIMESWDSVGVEMGYGPLGPHIFHTLGLNRASRKEYFFSQFGDSFPYDEFQDRYAKDTYRRTANQVPVKEGLYELLDFLKEENYRLAVATSSSLESATHKLTQSHLENVFDVIVCGDMVTHSKPDPEIYLTAARELGQPVDRLLALEDSKNGLKAALAAGLHAIMIPDLLPSFPDLEPQLDGKFERLDDLIEFFPGHYYRV